MIKERVESMGTKAKERESQKAKARKEAKPARCMVRVTRTNQHVTAVERRVICSASVGSSMERAV